MDRPMQKKNMLKENRICVWNDANIKIKCRRCLNNKMTDRMKSSCAMSTE